MKIGKQYEGIVEETIFPGIGIVFVDGDAVEIPGAIPGQKIRFSISKTRKGKCEGKLIEVLEKSTVETEAQLCVHFGPCGSCVYQTLPYEAELKIKERQAKALFDPVFRDYDFLGIKKSPLEWGYRNKMEFSFGDEEKGGPLTLGLHKKRSFYDIFTAEGCQIVDGDFRKILKKALEHFSELGIGYYKKQSHEGYLRHLVVRKAYKTGEILANLVTTTQWDYSIAERDAIEGFKNKLLTLELSGNIVGILHTYNDAIADVVKSDRTDILYGRDYFYEELLGLKFKISAFSFFQTNSLGAEVLYSTAREFVGDAGGKTILDLYCGIGTIGQILAPAAKKVVGVEIVEEAAAAARENAALNGLSSCEYYAGDVLYVLDEIQAKPEILVVDPPRDGVHPKALKKIIALGAGQIVYVSCNPKTLVRDVEVLMQEGYRVEKACCVDLFPHTPHVECVTLMSRVEK